MNDAAGVAETDVIVELYGTFRMPLIHIGPYPNFKHVTISENNVLSNSTVGINHIQVMRFCE